jgi:hypothetical protein
MILGLSVTESEIERLLILREDVRYAVRVAVNGDVCRKSI